MGELAKSPPIRRCGLKFLEFVLLPCYLLVTSYTEVWIEIPCDYACEEFSSKVTSYTEVWIEILILLLCTLYCKVTSYTEVWIEIKSSIERLKHLVSPPIRRCGLKSLALSFFIALDPSPPIRRCGLKYISSLLKQIQFTSPPIRRCGLKFLHHLSS